MSETNKEEEFTKDVMQFEKLTKGKDLSHTVLQEEIKIVKLQDVEFVELSKPFPSGLNILDDMFEGGFREGQLVLISGVSGHGKTQLSLQLTQQYSKQSIPVLWFSFEMPINELQWRFQNMGGYDDLLCYVPKKNVLSSVEWLELKIKLAVKNRDTKIVFIDNLDFLTLESKEQDDKLTVQKRIIGMLKRVAIDLGVVIFLNAHITKLEDGKEPRMQNVYGASETYKLADAIIFIHRLKEKVGRGEQELNFTNESKIIVDKNRLTGKLGQFKVMFKDNKFSLISNREEI